MLNEKKFREIYSGYLKSGLTIRDYCANHQMNQAKFFYWQNKLKGQLPPKRGFVPVVFGKGQYQPLCQVSSPNTGDAFTGNQSTQRPSALCEISYPNGVSIKLNSFPDVQVLQSLLLNCR
ncbi:MAG: hypothetical protein JXP36_02350 [Bacteroidales bacterium]|nr:hypothetical protein [Bacteroidales bacterium]